MSQFKVRWEIDIEADDPHQAATIALDIQRSDSSATVFEVIADNGDTTVIDLEPWE